MPRKLPWELLTMMIDPKLCYDTLVKTAKALPSEDPGEWHHIVPRSMHRWRPYSFGVNDPSNLVYLSHRQHLRAHYLLWEIYKDNPMMGPKMAHAFCMMAHTREMVKPTPKMLDSYAEAKIASSKAHREALSGENHPFYGLRGKDHPGSKNKGRPRTEGSGKPSKPVINAETGETWESVNECSRALGLTRRTIGMRIKNKSHGGIWMFLEDYEKEIEDGKGS